MAVKKNEARRATRKRVTSKVQSPGAGHRRKAPQAAKAAEIGEGEGLDLLRDAVVDELRKNGKKIAKRLREKSEAGDSQSTKLLMEIVQKPKTKKPAPGKSLAMEIASDRNWEAEAAAAKAAERTGEEPAEAEA